MGLEKPKWGRMPVVCDTLNVSSPVRLGPDIQEVLAYLENPENPSRWWVGGGRIAPWKPDEAPPPWAVWSAGRARLKALPGYRWSLDMLGDETGATLALMHDEDKGWRGRLMLGSEHLWRGLMTHDRGAAAAEVHAWETLAASWVIEQVPDAAARSVRRVDLCVDHWGFDWVLGDLYRWSTRMATRGECGTLPDVAQFQGRESRTFYLGKRGGRCAMLRLYLKTVEARATGKAAWIEPLWRAAGWDGESPVWRAEIECGGDWLREHGMLTAKGLDGIEARLWEHWTSTNRHTSGRRSRLKRDTTSPRWTHVMQAEARKPLGHVWTFASRPPPRPEKDLLLLRRMAAGCLDKVLDAYGDHDEGRATMLDDLMHDIAAKREKRAAG